MRNRIEPDAPEIRIALNEIYPDSAYGAVPGLGQHDALEAHRTYDNGGMEAIPEALAAYVDFHQRQWL